MALLLGGGELTRPPKGAAFVPTIIDQPRRPITARRPVPTVVPALGDERGFVHKRIFGGIKGAIGGILGGPAGIVTGGLAGILTRGRAGAVQAPTGAALVPSRRAALCPPGFFETPAGGCQALRAPEPTRTSFSVRDFLLGPQVPVDGVAAAVPGMVGEAVMGRFGAGFEPDLFATTTRRCGRGAVLGLDGICYNRRDLRNSERFWPRGRRPLLTGGEMRCIGVASAAAKKLQKKQKQLTELGLLKRPPSRSRRAEPTHVRTAAVAHN